MNIVTQLVLQARGVKFLLAHKPALFREAVKAAATAALASYNGDTDAVYAEIDAAFSQEFGVTLASLGLDPNPKEPTTDGGGTP